MSQNEKQEQNPAVTDQAEPNQAESSLQDTNGVQMPVGFDFIEKIGCGGFGTLVKAFQKVTRRTVTVKILQGTNLTEESRLRFHREAQILASLDHPNIQKVLGFGFIAETTPYIVNEYIDGMTLEEKLSKQKVLSLKEFAEVFPGLLEASEFLHERNIIHRDIKPGNIILAAAEEDEPAVPKLIDFGLAKLLDVERRDQKLTQTGAILGTPAYMSPEQSQGKIADSKSDLFALACVMYESLAGHPPWQAENPLELIYKRSSEKPASLDKGKVPAQLDKLISNLLSFDPTQRLTSTQAKNELENCIGSNTYQQLQDLRASGKTFKTKLITVIALASLTGLCLLFLGNQRRADLKPESTAVNSLHTVKVRNKIIYDLERARGLGLEMEKADLPRDQFLKKYAEASQLAQSITKRKDAPKSLVYSAYCHSAYLSGLHYGITHDTSDMELVESYYNSALSVAKINGKTPPQAYVAVLLLGELYLGHKPNLDKAETYYREVLNLKEMKKNPQLYSFYEAQFNIPEGLPGKDYPDENLLSLRLGQIWCHKGDERGVPHLKRVLESPHTLQQTRFCAAYHLSDYYRRKGKADELRQLRTSINKEFEQLQKSNDEFSKDNMSKSLNRCAKWLLEPFDDLTDACDAMIKSDQLYSFDASNNPDWWIDVTQLLIANCKQKKKHEEETQLAKQLKLLEIAKDTYKKKSSPK